MAISRLVPSAYTTTYAETQAAIAAGVEGTATGGTEVTSGGYKYHTFTASGTFTINGGYKRVEVLLVAAGGGGSQGGGGGGGGQPKIVNLDLPQGSYTITVGAGGANSNPPTKGNPSSFSGTYLSAITTIGGGAGRATVLATPEDDSFTGGGGGTYRSTSTSYTTYASGANGVQDLSADVRAQFGYTSSYGFGGGGAQTSLSINRIAGGGGGGATAAGSFGNLKGAGGDGTSDFSTWGAATSTGENDGTGTYYYSGGGGGSDYNGAVVSTASAGLGSNNGDPNTGGGGGASNGGSGVVIIRYAV